jgi:hypothetical protein
MATKLKGEYMKNLLLIIGLLTSVGAAQAAVKYRDNTLYKVRDFILLSDMQEKEVTIFVSYIGKISGQCGVSVRGTGVSGDDLDKIIKIRPDVGSNMGKEIGDVVNGELIATVGQKEDMAYGAILTLSTRSGRSLKTEIAELNDSRQLAVIVESTPCP